MIKKFKWFIKDYKNGLLLGFVFLLFSNIFGLIPPYIIGNLTDRIFSNNIDLQTLLKILGLNLLVIIIKYGFAFGWSYSLHKGSNIIEFKARDRLMDKFLKQSQKFYEIYSPGSLMARSTSDVDSIYRFAGFGALAMFDSTIFPLCIIIIMAITINTKLTLASVLPLPFLSILVIKIGSKIYEKFSNVQREFESLNDSVLEDVKSNRIIRVFNLQDYRRNLFLKKGQKLKKESMEVMKYEAMIEPARRIIPALTFIIAISYGSVLIQSGEITIGQLVSFTYYLNMLIWPMYALGEFINLKERAEASMDRIHEIWKYEEDIKEAENPLILEKNPDIEFRNYYFKYPSSKEYNLKNINLTIAKGSSLGVLGKTGSGKTTLLSQLIKNYPGDFTNIYLDGRSLSDYDIKSVRNLISYVPQEDMIFSKSIRENILFSKPDAEDEDLLQAIEMADLTKDLESFPAGLDTMCGERGLSLSGGQKQRIALARGLIKDPDILIIDDGMSAVDGKTEKNIIKNLDLKNRDQTVIIAAHRLSQVMDLDNIIVLENGEIVEEGSHDELMSKDTWYRTQFLRQMSRGELYE